MQRPTDRPDARMSRPACAVCNSHRTLSLFDQNVPCPACSAPNRADGVLNETPLLFTCPACDQLESITPGQPCGPCRGIQLARQIRPDSELWTLAAIVRDREAAQ